MHSRHSAIYTQFNKMEHESSLFTCTLARVTCSSQTHQGQKLMRTLKLNGFKRQIAVILMILTTIDFLVGEETNIFSPGNKIGRMHAQHPR